MLITRGRVLAQRFYDIADEVDLQRAASLVQSLSRRPRFVRSARQIRLPSPPLEMSLGTRPSPLPGFGQAEVLVRIYDVGALAVTFGFDLPTPLDGEGLIGIAGRILGGEDALVGPGRAIADEIVGAVNGACSTRNVSDVTEEYTIFTIQGTEPRVDADSIAAELDVARLLLGETGAISKRERTQQSHQYISYSPDELVVVDWNSALVFDRSGSSDIPDLLELASMQLLEMRAYDDILNRSLARLYDELGKPAPLLRTSKYTRLSREVMRLFVDVTEMSDRIENSLTTLGDSWLARVHRAAIAEFEVDRWSKLVGDKLDVLRQINEFLTNQITSGKSHRVEVAILLLIVFEILLALFRIV